MKNKIDAIVNTATEVTAISLSGLNPSGDGPIIVIKYHIALQWNQGVHVGLLLLVYN